MRSSELQKGQIFKGTQYGVLEIMDFKGVNIYLGRPGKKDYITLYDKKYFLRRVKQGKILLVSPITKHDYEIF